MYKVVIVDDEVISRVGIAGIIPWEKYGFEVIGHASNGAEAFEMFKKEKPDLVFTDVKMPLLDGINLIKKCKDASLGIEFVIISAFEDFIYVKEGLKLGAIDYILKSNISENQMITILEQCAQRLKSNNKDAGEHVNDNISNDIISAAKQDFLKSILYGEKHIEEIKKEILKRFCLDFSKSRVAVLLIKNNDTNSVLDHKMTISVIEDIITDYDNLYYSQTGFDEVSLLYNFDYISEGKDEENLRELASRFGFVIKQYFNTRVSVYISDSFNGINNIPLAYLQTCQAYNSRGIAVDLPVVFYKEVKELRSKVQDVNLEKELRMLKRSLDVEGHEAIKKCMDSLLKAINDIEAFSKGQLQYYIANILYIIKEFAILKSLYIVQDRVKEFEQAGAIEQIYNKKESMNLLDSLKSVLVEDLKERENSTLYVTKIKEYLRKNYSTISNLEELAEKIGLSYTYMSTLFKKEVGENIKDYLIGCRIDAAKSMLEDGNFQISQISKKVGYENEHYFSRMFKYRTGITPTAYRHNNLKK